MTSVLHSGAYVLSGNHYYESRASSAEMYLHRLSGQEKEPNIVVMDHCYAKAWNAHPDSHHAKPAKLLFMKDIPYPEGRDVPCEDVPVDVVAFSAKCLLPYDGSRARSLMMECERNASLCMRLEEEQDDWEEAICRDDWTVHQNRLFNKVAKILNDSRLARLSYENVVNEPIMRRLAVDTAAQKFRQVFALFGWDMKLLQWLHGVLMEKTSASYMAIYLDILQALKAKVPTLVEKMLSKADVSGRAKTIATETLNILLRRPWDPVAPFLSQHKPKRLPGSPLLILCPGVPGQAMNLGKPRGRFWFSQLSIMGKLIMVNASGTDSDGNMNNTLENMVSAVKTKVVEMKNHFPSRPIVLIGWMIGGVIACQVSLMESVAAVVCLGFPLVGVCGPRDVDDPMLDSHTPTLFVVGQNALSCGIDDIENFREHMKAESGLVVVGGADDGLHVSSLKKRTEGVTQSIVDRCIVDEMGAFLAWVLTCQHSGGTSTGHSATPSKANDASPLGGARRRRVGIREVPRRASEFNRRRGRQRHSPYFYNQSHYGGSSTDTTPGSSPTVHFSALGVQKKRGTGRRVGRPPKQVTPKQKFAAFSLGGVDLPTPPKQECMSVGDGFKANSNATHVEEGTSSVAEASDAAPSELSLGLPLFRKEGDIPPDASPPDGADLVPTPSLWTQSLIPDPFNISSPVSSPIRWFQQQSKLISKSLPSSSPSSAPDLIADTPPATEPLSTEQELSPRSQPESTPSDPPSLEAPSTSGELLPLLKPREDGRFVSLSASGIKVSLLEKSLVGRLPTSRIVASGGDFVTLPLVNFQSGHSSHMMVPMANPVDMASDLPSLESGVPTEEPLLSSDLIVGDCSGQDKDDEGPAPHRESRGFSMLEGFVRNGREAEEQGLARLHPEIASALATPSSHPSTDRTLGGHQVKTLSSRYRIPFPTIAATRTRRVRMPRFFDM